MYVLDKAKVERESRLCVMDLEFLTCAAKKVTAVVLFVRKFCRVQVVLCACH